MHELKLPELGENIDAVEVSTVLVAVGDVVKRDQPVIEVETEPRWIGPIEPVETPAVPALEEVDAE